MVKIYSTPVTSKGKKYPAFTVRYYFDDKTHQKKFASKADALKHADDAAKRINNGSVRVLLMTEKHRTEYFDAVAALKGVPLRSVVDFYLSRHPNSVTVKTTRDVYNELLISKKQDGISDSWYRDLKKRLLRFVEKFPAAITELSGSEIDAWLRSLSLSAKSRNNFRICISTMINFAKDHRYLPKDFSELDAVKILSTKGGAIEIFTPDEMEKLLLAAKPQDVPYLALGAFAGVRTAEMSRLTWQELGKEFITVSAAKAKTAQRRLVPILPNLRTWLDSVKKPTGSVWGYGAIFMHSDAIARLSKDSGVAWKKNGLRHSFISYRLAQVQNAGQVALEAGTSERKLFTNYRELVSVEAAAKWFDIYKPVTKQA